MTLDEPLRVLVADDEQLAREELCFLIEQHGEVVVTGQARDGVEALRLAGDLQPDLLFLDVQMPKLDGFEVLELVGGEVAVIFVTAFDQYAIRAFDVHAVDYLLKPFSPERLGEALARARERLARGERTPAAVSSGELAATARAGSLPRGRVLVRDQLATRLYGELLKSGLLHKDPRDLKPPA